MKYEKLNIGAGQTYIPGFVNIDISPKADISLDLNSDPLPFNDDSVGLVFSYHTLEHIDNYLFALSEIHRVLKHRGLFLVGFPYATLTEYHLVNPYHLHNFNEHSFDFFDPDILKGSAEEGNQIVFNKVFHRFHYIGGFHLIPPPIRPWCRRHLFNVVRMIDFGLLAMKYKKNPITVSIQDRNQAKRKFQPCLKARLPYEGQDSAARKGDVLYKKLRSVKHWWYRWQ